MNATSVLARRILAGCRTSLSRAITLTESTRSDHCREASALLSELSSLTSGAYPNTLRIGISGAPGAGKSSLIGAMGTYIASASTKLAVLTVDPSSVLSRGSILGDKTRMHALSQSPHVYVRQTPTGGVLGGLARRTDEAIFLCEMAAFNLIIVETVGVGQSESDLANAVDLFILLVPPAAGDDLQGAKKGVLERAHLVVINKADGALREQAMRTASDYSSAIEMGCVASRKSCQTKVVVHSLHRERNAQHDANDVLTTEQLWKLIKDMAKELRESGNLDRNRMTQRETWMWSETMHELEMRLRNSQCFKKEMPSILQLLHQGRILPRTAAMQLVNEFLKNSRPSSYTLVLSACPAFTFLDVTKTPLNATLLSA